MKVSAAVIGFLVTASLGCGGSTTGPSDGDATLSFPTVVPVGSTCGSGASAVYFIWGLSNNVRDPNARLLESVVPVGQTLSLESRVSRGVAAATKRPGPRRSQLWES